MAIVLLLAFPIAMIVAAATDLATMTIPNRLVIVLAGAFPLFALAAGWRLDGIGVHALTCAGALVVSFGCFAAGWMGGGDAKLIAAAALWLGPTPALVSFVAWTAVFGGVLTIAFLLARSCLAPNTGLRPVDRLLSPDSGIPYGVAIGAAGLLATPVLMASLP